MDVTVGDYVYICTSPDGEEMLVSNEALALRVHTQFGGPVRRRRVLAPPHGVPLNDPPTAWTMTFNEEDLGPAEDMR